MGKIHKANKGFTVVELLLVLIIVILLGFVGWYVYHTDHKKITPSNTAASTTSKSISYFTVTQWGVRAPYSGSLTLEDNVTTSDGLTFAALSSSQLDASDSACQVGGNYGGVIERYAPTDIVQDEGGNSGLMPAQFFSQNDISSSDYSHVGGYYYWYIQPQGICGSSQASQNLQSQTVSAFKSIVQSLQVVSSS